MEILVLHPGALGDIILSLPALRVLRDHFRDASITLAADTEYAAAAAFGYSDRILSLASFPLNHLFGSDPLPADDVRFWRFYDRIVSWTGSGSAPFAAEFARVHPCVLVSAWKPGPGEARHVARIFMESLAPWCPIPESIFPAEVEIRNADRLLGGRWLERRGWDGFRPVVALHPGAGSPSKRWPLGRFRELAMSFSDQADVLVIEGPAEPGLGRKLCAELGANAWLASELPLGVLIPVLSHCRAFVGNDSGLAHLAAGLKIPCVTIFGPTAPQLWAPLGPHVTVLHNTNRCVSCSLNRVPGHTCLENVSTEEVRDQLAPILAEADCGNMPISG